MARRSQKTIAGELDQLEELLRQHPAGLSRDEVEEFVSANWDRPLSRRTLLRRLKVLEEEDRIIVEGQGRSTLYKVADSITPPPQVAPVEEIEAEIPLSESGIQLRALILRPITRRAPVGYDRSFLEDYIPGRTWYLPGPMRQRLHERGSTPDPDRPAGTYAREIYENLLIDLSWASSRLEGNTYSRIDTASLLKFGRVAEGKDATEAQMVLNHKRAIDFLVENAESLAFDRRTLLTLHSMLAENLVGDPGDEGRLRKRMVQITGTSYTPVAIPQVIEDSFALFLSRADAIEDPFEQAFFTMVHLPYLQPFIDVNKRTSRLAANIPLFKANLCPLSFIDVPRDLYLQATLSIYETQRVELLRDVFEWAYERSCAQYRVVRDAIIEPDPLRLRYRDELEVLVRDLVLSKSTPTEGLLQKWAADHEIPREDRGGFVEKGLQILINLSEGTAGRYRISLEELQEWRDATASD